MHLGQCLAGTALVKDGDLRWQTPCPNGASWHVVIDLGNQVGAMIALCEWHAAVYRRENLFTNL
jgi:hypothetical protein